MNSAIMFHKAKYKNALKINESSFKLIYVELNDQPQNHEFSSSSD